MTNLPTKTCKRCGHQWVIRVKEPKRCPRCQQDWKTKPKKRKGTT